MLAASSEGANARRCLDRQNPKLMGASRSPIPLLSSTSPRDFLSLHQLEMQSVAVGWQVYDITHRAFDLGLVGLCQFLPGITLFLVSGHVADRFNRRNLLMFCYAGFATCSGLLLYVTHRGSNRRCIPIYAILVLLGVVRSFSGPVSQGSTAAIGSRTTFSECGGLAFDGIPGGHDPGAVDWRDCVCGFPWTFGSVCRGRSINRNRINLHYADSAKCNCPSARAYQPIHDSCRASVYQTTESNTRFDLAGSFRSFIGRGCGLAPCLRPRNSSHRSLGAGIVANCPGSRRCGDGRIAGISSAASTRRCDNALVCKRLRRFYDSFRPLPKPECCRCWR